MIRIEEHEFSEEIREKMKKTFIADLVLGAGTGIILLGLYIVQPQSEMLCAMLCLIGIAVIAMSRYFYKKHWICEGCGGKLPWAAYMKSMVQCTACGHTFITEEKRRRLEAAGEIERSLRKQSNPDEDAAEDTEE